jgi:hypothetical protein
MSMLYPAHPLAGVTSRHDAPAVFPASSRLSRAGPASCVQARAACWFAAGMALLRQLRFQLTHPPRNVAICLRWCATTAPSSAMQASCVRALSYVCCASPAEWSLGVHRRMDHDRAPSGRIDLTRAHLLVVCHSPHWWLRQSDGRGGAKERLRHKRHVLQGCITECGYSV